MTTRVQIPAYTDRWMMGDRYGTIVKVTNASAKMRAKLAAKEPRRYSGSNIEIAHVKLDKSGKTVRVILADCT